MPRPTTKKLRRFRWSTGRRGKNRVVLYPCPRSGTLTLEWYEGQGDQWKRRYRSLEHTDLERGKKEAEDQAEKLRHSVEIRASKIWTLGALFEIYEREVVPSKGPSARSHNRRTFPLFLRLWGKERVAASLSIREWNGFITARRSGALAPGGRGKPVRNQIIRQDLSLLMAVMNWATVATDSERGYLLERNPLKGFPMPVEENPSRPMLKEGDYDELVEPASKIDPRLALALILHNETGHRLNSVRQVKWSEIDFEDATIFWRAESEKMKREHRTPLLPPAVSALKAERQRQLQAGRSLTEVRTGFVFYSPRRPNTVLNRGVLYKLWGRLREVMPEALPARLAFHAFRRKLASDMSEEPSAIVAAAGGWLNPDVAVRVYQRPSVKQIRSAMERVRATG